MRNDEEQKIFDGVLYCPADPGLREMKERSHDLSARYSQTREGETETRRALLAQMLARVGEGTFMQGPVFFHYGKHTSIGARCFFNYNLTVQDDAEVVIGDDCNFGPNFTVVTPGHPLLPDERKTLLCADGVARHMCYAKPVRIGNDCWFGANVTVCPGVTVGDGCVVGAGSVVTRDIPAMSVAAGVPCRVLRSLTDADSMAFQPQILADNRVIGRREGTGEA